MLRLQAHCLRELLDALLPTCSRCTLWLQAHCLCGFLNALLSTHSRCMLWLQAHCLHELLSFCRLNACMNYCMSCSLAVHARTHHMPMLSHHPTHHEPRHASLPTQHTCIACPHDGDVSSLGAGGCPGFDVLQRSNGLRHKCTGR